jgi:RNA polymerase sigma factor (sigma-70 family)
MPDDIRPPKGSNEPIGKKQPLSITDPFATSLIGHVARKLARQKGFSLSDEPDIRQVLLIKLWESESSFDPEIKPWPVYATTVIVRHAATLRRDRCATKRYRSRMVSLSVQIGDDDGLKVEMVQTIGLREHNNRRRHHPKSDEELARLRQDVAAVVDKLPEDVRDVLKQLMEDSVTEVARRLDIPPSTLRSRLKQLRHPFEDC